jgi:hypothetical protein
MKLFFALTLLSTFVLSSLAFAAETTTECPMMREANERNNPKAGLSGKESKPKTKGGAIQQ